MLEWSIIAWACVLSEPLPFENNLFYHRAIYCPCLQRTCHALNTLDKRFTHASHSTREEQPYVKSGDNASK